MWQAHERQIGVKFCYSDLSKFADLADARYRGKDRYQLCGAGDNQIPTLLRCQRQIAGKLDRIGGFLFRVDYQSLLGYRLAVPLGVRRMKPIELPPLPFGKAPRIVSDLKQVQTEVEVGLGVIRLQLDGALTVANRLVGFAQPARDISQTVIGLGVFFFGLDNLSKA